MIPLTFEKLSQFDRTAELCTVAIPFPAGELTDISTVAVRDADRPVPTQCRATATWPDGSIKWLLVHFPADLPGNAGKTFSCRTDVKDVPAPPLEVTVEEASDGCTLGTGDVRVELLGPGELGLFRRIETGSISLSADEIIGPVITDSDGVQWVADVGDVGWRVVESGPLRVVVEANGRHRSPDGPHWLDFTARVLAFAGKPWIRFDYQIMHCQAAEELRLEGIRFALKPERRRTSRVRTALATSNYGSNIRLSNSGELIQHVINAEELIYEANEQVPETLYGTFWADWNDPDTGGVSVTVHQAHQNFPKALGVDGSGLEVWLLPEGQGGLTLIRGMAKTHRMYLHLHGPGTTLEDLNVRSLQFQMPDRPTLPAAAYRRADVLEDVWVDRPVRRVERHLIDLADNRTRGYGILNWGDGPDRGYTEEGRGRGELVWTNHEYDLPHAALLMYARTGERRMLDYLLVSARHWMEVDVCHSSDDPLRHQGMIYHSARHATGGVIPSHEWVEGLLDYYHQTGEQFAYETALGIGENVLRQLERPEFRRPAGTQARETGWALRTLTALRIETHDEKWMEAASDIVDQFQAWREEYGAWLSPYTDHTLVRVPFMISVAVNSLMRYHRIRPEQRVADMIVDAVRDMVDNCLTADGRFYYKELPSLRRRGAGGLILEALACAHELSGDNAFLEVGMPTFELVVGGLTPTGRYTGPKYVAGDAVIWPQGPGPKAFASMFPSVMAFYRAATKAGLLR